jgi:hypothetical protein
MANSVADPDDFGPDSYDFRLDPVNFGPDPDLTSEKTWIRILLFTNIVPVPVPYFLHQKDYLYDNFEV